MGVRNIGYNDGIYVEKGANYLFSCYVGCNDSHINGVRAAITDADGKELCSEEFKVDFPKEVMEKETQSADQKDPEKKIAWKKYELV